MLLEYIKQNPFFLAPMAGVTDKPFRSFMKSMGCGMITSELVSAKALMEGSLKTKQLMSPNTGGGPFGVQIFGSEAEALSEGAKRVAAEIGPDFIDLNLGCPVNKIVKKGAGSALLKDLKHLRSILKSLRDSVSLPLSLKVRTGWDEKSRNALEVSQMAFDEGFSWITIHGRSRAQGYSGLADWSYIAEVASKSPLPVVGNGDVHSASQAIKVLKTSFCKALMIGRACLSNPLIFKECKAELSGSLFQKPPLKELIWKLSRELEAFYEERIFLIQLKKFAAWFSAGRTYSGQFRQKLFQTKEKQAAWDLLLSFFEESESVDAISGEYDPLLRQGHG